MSWSGAMRPSNKSLQAMALANAWAAVHKDTAATNHCLLMVRRSCSRRSLSFWLLLSLLLSLLLPLLMLALLFLSLPLLWLCMLAVMIRPWHDEIGETVRTVSSAALAAFGGATAASASGCKPPCGGRGD